jgi:hypothetical protein
MNVAVLNSLISQLSTFILRFSSKSQGHAILWGGEIDIKIFFSNEPMRLVLIRYNIFKSIKIS